MAKKMQKGGPPDFPDLGDIFNGGDFTQLFGDLFTPKDDLGYSYNDQNYTNKDDFLRDYFRDNVVNKLPKRMRDRAMGDVEESILSGSVYDDPKTQNILNDARLAGISSYFSSPQFKEGFTGLLGQYQEYQKNLEMSKMSDSVDQRPFTVGEDRGFKSGGGIHIKPENKGKFTAFAKRKGMGVQEAARHVLANKDKYSSTQVKRANFARNASKWKHQEGGDVGDKISLLRKEGYKQDQAVAIALDMKRRGKYQMGSSVPMNFISLQTGLSPDELAKFSQAVKEHESFSDYSRLQDKGGPGAGAYQFDKSSMITAARKAKKIYERYDMDPPEIYDEILSGKIKGAEQLAPQIQDELFYAHLTQIKPVKDKSGKVMRYDILPIPGFSKYDINDPLGAANIWQLYHNKGDIDRKDSFLESLTRIPSYQQGGMALSTLKHLKADEGDYFALADGNVVRKNSQLSTEGYRKDSPDRNKASLTIPGDTISMDKVNMDLMLIPDTGEPVVAFAGDPKLYSFPGASFVEEIPLAKKGKSIYQEGGEVFEEDLNKILEDELSLRGYLSILQGWGKIATEDRIKEVYKKNYYDKYGPEGLKKRLQFMGQQDIYHENPSVENTFKLLGRAGAESFDSMFKDLKHLVTGKYQEGGDVEEEPQVIQAEKGEEIAFPDYTLTPVKAKKRHKNMSDDDATDIVPPGSYIFSRDKNMKLKKKDADEISFGFGPMQYKENEAGKAPREELFSEIFRRKEELPANISKRIRSIYPTTERKGDSFASLAIQENKTSRVPYVEALKAMSEMKKDPKNKENFQFGGTTFSSGLYKQPYDKAITNTLYSDLTLKRDKALKTEGVYTKPLYTKTPNLESMLQKGGYPKYQNQGNTRTGGIDPVSAIAGSLGDIYNIVGDIFGFSAEAKARKRLEANQAQTEQDLDAFRATQSQRNALGLGIGAASTLAQFVSQDPSYDFLRDQDEIDAIRSRTQNTYQGAIRDTQAAQRLAQERQQAPINTLYRSLAMADPNQAMVAADSAYAGYLNAAGEQALRQSDQLNQLRLQEAEALSNLDFTLAQDTQRGRQYEKAAQNVLNQSLFQGLGAAGQNYLAAETNADVATISGKMAARSQTASGLNQIGFVQQDNLKQGLDTLGDLYVQSRNQNAATTSPTSQVGSSTLPPSQNPCGHCTGNGPDVNPYANWDPNCKCWY